MKEKKGVKEFVGSWNKFITDLIVLERSWKIMTKFKEKYEISLEDLPDESQKALSRVNFRSRFTVGVVRFIEFIERFGNFEDCLIKVVKKKEVDNGRRSNDQN